jgi:hypothetical protein
VLTEASEWARGRDPITGAELLFGGAIGGGAAAEATAEFGRSFPWAVVMLAMALGPRRGGGTGGLLKDLGELVLGRPASFDMLLGRTEMVE